MLRCINGSTQRSRQVASEALLEGGPRVGNVYVVPRLVEGV